MKDLVRWNPWNEMVTLRDGINRLFDDSFFSERADNAALSHWYPSVDIYEKDDSFVVNAELPGISKKNIEIDLKGNVLTIKGTRSYDKEIKEEKFYKRERAFGKFQRSFTLSDLVDGEKIKAEHKDGVLKITIPKSEKQKPKQITVN